VYGGATPTLPKRLSLVNIARLFWTIFLVALLAVGVQSLFVFQTPAREDLPWTSLDLRVPIGLFTGRKLAALDRDPELCLILLKQAGVGFVSLPARHQGDNCGWRNAVRLNSTPSAGRPHVPLACPLAASVDLWMRRVVQPAAVEILGSRVTGVEDFGSYACRHIYNRAEGNWSEHAFANAIDISGFGMADGRRVTVARDWRNGARGAFLHKVRDGACRLFATTLSPDYNAAHRDHLHLDEAPRAALGWKTCG
jgi:hypothetical protein